MFYLGVAMLCAAGSVCANELTRVDRETQRLESLPTIEGKSVRVFPTGDVRYHVLCFLGTECPLARVYGPRLQRLADSVAAQGVRFIGVNSNIQDSMDELRQYAKAHGIKFALAKDYDRKVATLVGASRTPEIFVVDRSGAVHYRGRIDDQYEPGVSRNEATQHDLRDALAQLLDGQRVTRPVTTAVGCLIARPREVDNGSDVTYCNQVARILQQHCVECHRDDQIGPFALNDYDEVIGWGDMSIEVIDQKRMPPWHADPEIGEFANARQMPQRDKETLRQWVEAGMPYGDVDQLPPAQRYVEGWRLPEKADLVVDMSDQPYHVPAEGTVEYQYFVVDPGFTEDKWIRAAEVQPGNRAVVHHAIAFIRPPDGSDFRDIGFLSAYVPGQVAGEFPKGYAQRVAAGSRIVFQMHYTPNGKPEQDRTSIGLVFADPDDVTHEVRVIGGIEQDFEIPPGASEYRVESHIGSFPRDGHLLTITPHMHLRGKSFEFSIELAGGDRPLLHVPAYDFNWQHNYALSEPIALRDVERMSFTAVFDNSENNPFNPDPSEYVTWGDQTWQEMAVTFVSVAEPIRKDARERESESSRSRREAAAKQRKQREEEWHRDSVKFATQYLERFDENGDGVVTPHELPDSVRMFSFWSLDHDNDGVVSREEIEAERYARLRRR